MHTGAEMQPKSPRHCATLALAVLLCARLPADTPTATVTGTITDATGGVLADVTVAATDTDTGLARATTTTHVGVYLLLGLQAGAMKPLRHAPDLLRRSELALLCG